MHEQQRWRQMILGTRAANTVGSTLGRRALVRAGVLAACFALLGQGTAQQAGAVDTDVSGAKAANVAVCQAAGGSVEVLDNSEGFVSV
jgi:hypothetical protein